MFKLVNDLVYVCLFILILMQPITATDYLLSVLL